jgi:hypothetical protein
VERVLKGQSIYNDTRGRIRISLGHKAAIDAESAQSGMAGMSALSIRKCHSLSIYHTYRRCEEGATGDAYKAPLAGRVDGVPSASVRDGLAASRAG